MLVFISWSGERSRLVAQGFQRWLSQVIQIAEPWISSDIDKGIRWDSEIGMKLERSKLGIICLTRENIDSRWILFEAGALSKTRDAHVCTLLVGIEPSDVEPPLSQFQHTSTSKEDIRQLLSTINEIAVEEKERSLSESTLSEVFESNWQKLETVFAEAAVMQAGRQKPNRSQKEIIGELLDLTRYQNRSLSRIEKYLASSLIYQLENLNHFLQTGNPELFSDKMLRKMSSDTIKVMIEAVTRQMHELLPGLQLEEESRAQDESTDSKK